MIARRRPWIMGESMLAITAGWLAFFGAIVLVQLCIQAVFGVSIAPHG